MLDSVFISELPDHLYPEIKKSKKDIEQYGEIKGHLSFYFASNDFSIPVTPETFGVIVAITEGDIYKSLDVTLEIMKSKGGKYFSAEAIEHIRNACKLLINMILYISSPSKDEELIYPKVRDIDKLKNKAKQRKAKKHEGTKSPYYSMGKNIVISKELHEAYKEAERTNEKHTLSWMVRGHWRNQAIGKGLSEHKLIWIEPYIKGESMAEMVNKKYVVKK